MHLAVVQRHKPLLHSLVKAGMLRCPAFCIKGTKRELRGNWGLFRVAFWWCVRPTTRGAVGRWLRRKEQQLKMSENWGGSEVQELRAEDKINRHITGAKKHGSFSCPRRIWYDTLCYDIRHASFASGKLEWYLKSSTGEALCRLCMVQCKKEKLSLRCYLCKKDCRPELPGTLEKIPTT